MAFTLGQLLKKPNFENTCRFLGDNPDSAIWVACLIALFKGISRPLFTLSDKKSDPKTKKFAALREMLTEGIAIPIYIAVPKILGAAITNIFYKNKSEATKKAVGANLKFIGVLASTAIIPAICNVVQPPMMAYFKRRSDAKHAVPKNNNNQTVADVNKPSFAGNRPINSLSKINYGMRIGS